MRPYIRKGKSKSGATTVQVEYKEKSVRKKIIHVGSAHNEIELKLLIEKADEIINAGQLSLELSDSENSQGIYLEKTYSKTLWDALDDVYQRLGFNSIDDEIFKQLVLCRIIEPTSKLDTIRVLEELGLAVPSYTTIFRSLGRCIENDYRNKLSEACLLAARKADLKLILYDVTTLYFEAEKEDEYRKAGLSKERKLDPQIVVGLLVDKSGFPLEVMSFAGNKGEVKTIQPVIENFMNRYKTKDITITADAAMLSASNISALEKLGYSYIIASKMARFPDSLDKYLKLPETKLQDRQIFETARTVTINGRQTKRRCVYQYSHKRALLDLRNIEKSVNKATKMIEGKKAYKRNKYLTISGAIKDLNTSLIEQNKRRAGIKGYITNLKIPAQEVITSYHQLFEVEKSFRMSKSDLRARPIFHHRKDSIEAHLTIVFAALAISRYIQRKTSVSIKRFISVLAPIRTGVLCFNDKKTIVSPILTEEALCLLNLLK